MIHSIKGIVILAQAGIDFSERYAASGFPLSRE
jgi:hypothetical protein